MADDDERRGSMDGVLGFLPGTVDCLLAVEASLSDVGLAQKQQVLASALWRAVTSHPSLGMTADFDLESIVVERGGRRVSLGLLVFGVAKTFAGLDRELPELEPVAFKEPTVVWRGSVVDLVTDLKALLSVDQLQELAGEAALVWRNKSKETVVKP